MPVQKIKVNGEWVEIPVLGPSSAAMQAAAEAVLSDRIDVNGSVAASTPGTVVRKIEVFDANGVSLGFIAVYDAIS